MLLRPEHSCRLGECGRISSRASSECGESASTPSRAKWQFGSGIGVAADPAQGYPFDVTARSLPLPEQRPQQSGRTFRLCNTSHAVAVPLRICCVSLLQVPALLIIGIIFLDTANAQDRSQARSMVITRYGIVATEQPLASQIGVRILEG